ncbi:MAG: phosphoribosylamine--glycine ligase [Pseudomonadota bacterium]
MKILIIGSGAREHALAKAIGRSPRLSDLYYAGTHLNPGIAALATAGTLEENVLAFAQAKAIGLVIIGPEKPLASGLADALQHQGIAVVGPTQKLAQIETSKGFTRDLMKKYGISGLPHYQRFSTFNHYAEGFLHDLKDDYVLKADGLMAGKGVSVAGEHIFSLAEAKRFCQTLNSPFVIEEKLTGAEFSLLSFSDGKTLAHMPPVQDHKRLLVGDKGPNTGGMGSVTLANHLLPFLTAEDVRIAQKINENVIAALQAECAGPYQGVIYGGFMKTSTGIKVIEYNARFGDPEAINLLGLLTTDFVTLCEAITSAKLHTLSLTFARQASVCQYLVPHGYPDKPHFNDLYSQQLGFRQGAAKMSNRSVYGIHEDCELSGNAAENSSAKSILDLQQVYDQDALHYASVVKEKEHGHYRMLGSRALAVLGTADTLSQAKEKVATVIAGIQGNYYYRYDIGQEKKNV